MTQIVQPEFHQFRPALGQILMFQILILAIERFEALARNSQSQPGHCRLYVMKAWAIVEYLEVQLAIVSAYFDGDLAAVRHF